MKKIITLFLLGCLIQLPQTFATAFTVCNNTNLPGTCGQFSDIASAITAASPTAGDTIFVDGSPFDYAGFTLNKKIVLIGPGYNPDVDNPLTATISSSVILANGSSGSTIMGLVLKSTMQNQAGFTLSNLIVKRNYFKTSGLGLNLNPDSTSNVQVLENIFATNPIQTSKAAGLVIRNNVFLVTSSFFAIQQSASNVTTSPVVIDHNLFMNGSFTTPIINNPTGQALRIRNSVISNNIFYNVRVSDTTLLTTSNANNAFLNNITFAGTNLTQLPFTNSVGSGNLNNLDPQMVKMFSSSSNPNLDFNADNLRLKPTSPCIGMATDKSNIGPTGGANPIYLYSTGPLTGSTNTPQVRIIYYSGNNSTVPPGGTLNLNITGRKRN